MTVLFYDGNLSEVMEYAKKNETLKGEGYLYSKALPYLEAKKWSQNYPEPEIINAEKGASNNLAVIESIRYTDPEAVILTNSIITLNNKYVWNEKENQPNIFVWSIVNQKYIHIKHLSKKGLKKNSDIAKMYLKFEILHYGNFDEKT